MQFQKFECTFVIMEKATSLTNHYVKHHSNPKNLMLNSSKETERYQA